MEGLIFSTILITRLKFGNRLCYINSDMDLFKRQCTSLLLAALAIVAVSAMLAGSYYFYQEEYKLLTSKVSSLENQVVALSQALQESSTVSEANKQQLQELSNRRDVISRSQDDLLTTTVAKAAPAVVSIVISKDVPLLEVHYENPFGNDPFFRDFGIRVPTYRHVGTQKQQVGAGTGFIIRSDGYILTNRHVVSDTDAEYTALLSSGEQKTAKVIYRDDTYDLAILKIEGGDHPALSFGSSSLLRLGQTVTAIGNALGEYNNSVSVGIISGLNRTIQARDDRGRVETLENVIQTDAAINRGNSGGPLLDLEGQVIGVNVAMDRYANDIAFAIPIDAVKPIISRILP